MNSTAAAMALPPLPEYILTPQPPIIAGIPDKLLTLIAPIAAYWLVSMLFHWIDVKDYFAAYRLHTPAEILKRNHVSRYEVARDVVIQQIIQTIVGGLMALSEPDDFVGKETYDVAVWARRIRVAQRAIPPLLALLGVDAQGLAKTMTAYPRLAGAWAGGVYTAGQDAAMAGVAAGGAPSFARWEVQMAQAVYWLAVPALQYWLAVVTMDTWQYFLHRAMHMNRWLYSKSLFAPPLYRPS